MTSTTPTAAFHFAHLFLPSGWVSDARLTCRDGSVEALDIGVPAQPEDCRLEFGLPGMPNLHSHAFQRGMSGLAEVRGPEGDSFWTWRELMYRFAERIDPEQLAAIAALAYMEMLESGFTRVGEFHYLHHDSGGQAYADRAEMSAAIVAAALDTGIGLTHLPVFYAHSGFGGQPPQQRQCRFINSLDGFAALLERLPETLRELPDAVFGIAPHSLRAVTPAELSALQALGKDRPIHIHIAEQTQEMDDCLAWSGARPVEWLIANAAVDARWSLIHATHADDAEVQAIAKSGAVVGLCPITEANLGDGIFPADVFADRGGAYGIGSDSNVLIDMTEELRLLEYGQRLRLHSRNVMACTSGLSTGEALYRGALDGGSRSLGVKAALTPRASADFVTLDTNHPNLALGTSANPLDAAIFGAGQRAIDGVWRRGCQVVAQGRHTKREAIVHRYGQALRALAS